MALVRPLVESDFDSWLPLWSGYLEFYEVQISDEVTRHTFNRLVDENSVMFGALAVSQTGEPIGLVHWLLHPGTWSVNDTCYLEDLFVAHDSRGSGVGRALIQHVREWAQAESLAKVYWLTADSNQSAQRLYDRVATKTGFIQYQIPLGN